MAASQQGSEVRNAWRYAGLPSILLAISGFALTLFVFWPGVMTYDALYVYNAIAEGEVGDWQSPVMTVLWAVIDPIAPGPGSLLLLQAALYWSGFALIGTTIARRAPWLGVIAVLLAFLPPAFMFVGIIWRDVLFAAVWLFAAALVFAAAESRAAVRLPAQVIALALIVLGVMLRTNALFAAPVLVAYALWPRRFAWKRAAVVSLPAVLALYGLVQVVYYDVLGAMRQHPLHSLYVFDLGGITYFTGENQFPVKWSPAEQQRLVTDCYDRLWDIYWYDRRCEFVMGRLEKEQDIFGTPALSAAWRHALLAHPLAYIRHRLAFMAGFLGGRNFTIWTQDLDEKSKIALPENRGFVALLEVHAALKSTPLFRAGLWFALCVTVFALACRREGLSWKKSPPPLTPPHMGEGKQTPPATPLHEREGKQASSDELVDTAQHRSGSGQAGLQRGDALCSLPPCGGGSGRGGIPQARRARVYETPAGAFALAMSGSAIVYVLTYLPFGVAPDFRYAYWAVLAALAGGATAISMPSRMPDAPQHAC
ncbi:MAG: hypothetical protein R3D62_16845 [Xanthobacteraceae bacterium]